MNIIFLERYCLDNQERNNVTRNELQQRHDNISTTQYACTQKIIEKQG